jgi:hypothetical protein
MNIKRSRTKKPVRSKPGEPERLHSLEHNKRLKAKKTGRAREAIYMRILGGVMMVGTIYIWYWRVKEIPMSILAIIGGIIVAGMFKVKYPEGINSRNNIRNVLSYLFIGSLLLAIINRAAFGLATLFWFSLSSAIFLFGVMKSFPESNPQGPSGAKGG